MATKALRDSTHANVMLVSLRAGNARLNLTAATRVVIMDPFWNPYIEMQAIDRTHRIGQHHGHTTAITFSSLVKITLDVDQSLNKLNILDGM